MLGILTMLLLATFCGFWWLTDDFDPEAIGRRRVVVTGASSELGSEIAYHYCRLGARLVLTGRREGRLREVAHDCMALGAAQAEVVVADLFYRRGRAELLEEIRKRLSGLDDLILSHGSMKAVGWWMGTADNLTTLVEDFHLNFVGYVDLVDAALPLLAADSGRLGIVTSQAGTSGAPGLAPLAASRLAIEGYFSTLRQELKLKRLGVSVTTCYLGFVKTSTNQQRRNDGHKSAPRMAAVLPSDAARAVLRAVSGRAYRLYYPFTEWLAVVVRRLFPNTVEEQFRKIALP